MKGEGDHQASKIHHQQHLTTLPWGHCFGTPTYFCKAPVEQIPQSAHALWGQVLGGTCHSVRPRLRGCHPLPSPIRDILSVTGRLEAPKKSPSGDLKKLLLPFRQVSSLNPH